MERRPNARFGCVAVALIALVVAAWPVGAALSARTHHRATSNARRCVSGRRVSGYCRTLIALDTYSRTLAPGELGSSDRGGLWSVYTTKTVSVDGAAAQAVVAPAHTNRDYLNTVQCGNCDVEIDVSWNKPPSGSGSHFYICARTNAHGNPAGYSLLFDARATPVGTVQMQLAKYDAVGNRTLLGRPVTVSRAYRPGQVYRIRFRLLGRNLHGQAWLRGTRPPARWQVNARDGSFRRGGVGLRIVNTEQARDTPLFVVDNLAAYRLSS
jgi:hypothetical protein